jgi:hypothetical protein
VNGTIFHSRIHRIMKGKGVEMARKSTEKEVREQIAAYILEAIDPAVYGVSAETPAEKLKFLADTLKKEAFYPANIKRFRGNTAAIIADHFQGLPSYFNIAFSYYDILQLAYTWGTLDQDASEAKQDRILKNYWNFMANKTLQLMKRHGVTI